MSKWKGAWFLAKQELVRDRWRSIITVAFIGYLLLFSVPLFLESMTERETDSMSWLTDFIYLSLLPCLGFVLNNTMMNYYKKDSYSRKLAYLRTLPITPQQIALGRLIQLTLVLFAAQLIFFAAQYVIIYFSFVEIDLGDFALYALFWFGYSLTIAMAYVYWEIGHSGKVYFAACIVTAILFLAIAAAVSWLGEGNIVIGTLGAIEEGKWWIALITPVICAITLPFGYRVLTNRLLKRSYTV
ncbi:hypothetical protein [Paenibacillus harenae]|uniref:ABC transporter permease n=1 Tax=Paenibacillus harenae TaxID=306543 RepID=A0ABT9TY27_PAEHA|nr:hypothetical protein [Paenibacillus harenae]MDQ0112264.1 hypothetical protein [Paenibacillus harenae]